MKSILAHEFGGPEVLKYQDRPDPNANPGEVIIEVKAAGINPADTYMRGGSYALVPVLPYTPGGDAAGVVCDVGEGVTDFAVGDRVFTATAIGFNMTGCYAEKVRRQAEDVMKIPDNVSFAQAACLGIPYATAHYALFARGGSVANETVFIHGASGSVGTAAIQLAKRAGMTVIGSAGSERGLQLVTDQGADHAVDHTQEGYIETVRDLTGGDGPNIILEMLANVNLAADLDLVAMYGRIIVIGNRGETTINARTAMMKELDVRGIALFNGSREQMIEIMDDLMSGLQDGSLNPIVGTEMPLSEAAAGHIKVLEPGAFGKIVLVP
jgi:NADPH2:quinone reductase